MQEAIKIVYALNAPWFKPYIKNGTTNPVDIIASQWERWGLKNFDKNRNITRLELAVLLNTTVDPFAMKPLDHNGNYQ